MNDEYYFCLRLTENEHGIVEYELREKCDELGLEMIYYRKLKEGHVPMLRETKIVGNRTSLFKLGQHMENERLNNHLEKNPHAEDRRYSKQKARAN
jgi:hypothetical protein